MDVSFLILPLTNITSIPSDQLLYVSFTQKVPEAEIGTVRFSLEWTTGIHFFISFLRLDGFSSGRIMWSDFRHHKVWPRFQPWRSWIVPKPINVCLLNSQPFQRMKIHSSSADVIASDLCCGRVTFERVKLKLGALLMLGVTLFSRLRMTATFRHSLSIQQ